MKQLFFILTVLFCTSKVIAQNNEPTAYIIEDGYDFWHKGIGDTAHVFADMAYIRSQPKTSSALIDSLAHEHQVVVISEPYNNATIRGFEGPWYKIIYLKKGERKVGYIWSGLLAIGRIQDNFNNTFSYGFLRRNKTNDYNSGDYLLQVKVFDRNKQLLAKDYCPAELIEQRYTEHKLLTNMGLEGIKNIFRVGFLAESCGVPTIHYYFSWNGKEIKPMFNKQSVSDAGVYSYTETILFPSEHGLTPNLIIKDIEEAEVIDDAAEEYEYKKTRSRVKYIWDGKTIAELMEMHINK